MTTEFWPRTDAQTHKGQLMCDIETKSLHSNMMQAQRQHVISRSIKTKPDTVDCPASISTSTRRNDKKTNAWTAYVYADV